MYIMIQYFCPPGILRKIDENVALFRTLIQTNITGKIKEELEKYIRYWLRVCNQ